MDLDGIEPPGPDFKIRLRALPMRRTHRPIVGVAYVYFVQARACGPIKIGFSRDVLARLIRLQIGNPNELVLLAACEGSERDESALHSRFADLWVRGEWFREAHELLAFIASLEGP